MLIVKSKEKIPEGSGIFTSLSKKTLSALLKG
jgi:hypothetical protein